jgi:hypothetical protein
VYLKVRLNVCAKIFAAKGAIVVTPQIHLSHIRIREGDCRPALASQRAANAARESDRRASRAAVHILAGDAWPPHPGSFGSNDVAAEIANSGGDSTSWHDTILSAAISGGTTLASDLDVMLAELELVFTALRRFESSQGAPVASKSASFH